MFKSASGLGETTEDAETHAWGTSGAVVDSERLGREDAMLAPPGPFTPDAETPSSDGWLGVVGSDGPRLSGSPGGISPSSWPSSSGSGATKLGERSRAMREVDLLLRVGLPSPPCLPPPGQHASMPPHCRLLSPGCSEADAPGESTRMSAAAAAAAATTAAMLRGGEIWRP